MLQETIKNILGNETLTAREIINKGNIIGMSARDLAYLLRNMECIQIIYGTPNKYQVVIPIIFTGKIEKNKNILSMELNDGQYIQYDFNKKNFISPIVPNRQAKGIGNNIVLKIFSDPFYSYLRDIEWLYSYIDLLDNNITNFFSFDFFTCPSGYINWLKENNLKINTNTFIQYSMKTQFKYVPKSVIELVQNKYRWHDRDTQQDILIICNTLFQNININKILNNSIKKYEWNIGENFCTLINILYKLDCIEVDWLNLIDNNRSLLDNIKNLNNILDKPINDNLKRLNFINNLEIEDYIIIVPQNPQDLIEEGKQQNNCVGHYYNDSIAKGLNLIYFIRDKDNIHKSLITCRYNINTQETVEHRVKNNHMTNSYQNEIIKKIDKIINEQLTKEQNIAL